MYSLDELSALTEESVAKLKFPAEPALLYEPVKYTLEAGGKRLRPMLALASCAVFNDNPEAAADVAMAIETFHNFTLLHDDIMDNADKRRGRETVHVKWNENVAILSGDAMVIYAYKLISRNDPAKLPALINVFNEFALGVCEGQQYDMNFETSLDVSVDEYMNMIRLKTAVMIAGSAQMGAITGGASEENAARMYDFGIALGLGFQLQDDLLDTYGDPAIFGKNIGGDIMCNKKTFLLIKALELAEGVTKKKLLDLLSAENPVREEKISAVREIYDATGVRELAHRAVDKYFSQAENILASVNAPANRKTGVMEILNYLKDRNK